jgi:type I restriction enzyme, S subunit
MRKDALVSLGSVVDFKNGGTPSKANPANWTGTTPWFSPKDMGDSLLHDSQDHVTAEAVTASAARLVPPATVLVVVRSGILAHTLPVGITTSEASFNQDIKALIPDQNLVDSQYLFWFLKSQERHILTQGVKRGATVHSLHARFLEKLKIPLPPLSEQRRIVDILNHVDSIRRLRRQAEQKAREIIPALFVEMFGDPVTNPGEWPTELLQNVADIGSGVTKGRKLEGVETVTLPYLRVANVQDGRLELGEIKTIEVKVGEVDKYSLHPGDLVMTEGGDPDKLGRGALWGGQVPLCLHQNHIFRVRAHRDRVKPEYLQALVGSQYGKRYFMQVAKQTTGIASINKTQLGRFPVLMPPLALQERFIERMELVTSAVIQQSRMAESTEATLQALMARYFDAS